MWEIRQIRVLPSLSKPETTNLCGALQRKPVCPLLVWLQGARQNMCFVFCAKMAPTLGPVPSFGTSELENSSQCGERVVLKHCRTTKKGVNQQKRFYCSSCTNSVFGPLYITWAFLNLVSFGWNPGFSRALFKGAHLWLEEHGATEAKALCWCPMEGQPTRRT